MAAGAEIFAFGDFELDEARCELRRVGAAVELQATPFRLLQHLIHERERVVSKEELLEAVWPVHPRTGPRAPRTPSRRSCSRT